MASSAALQHETFIAIVAFDIAVFAYREPNPRMTERTFAAVASDAGGFHFFGFRGVGLHDGQTFESSVAGQYMGERVSGDKTAIQLFFFSSRRATSSASISLRGASRPGSRSYLKSWKSFR